MMWSDWQAQARKQIAALDAQFAPEMTWQDRQKVLREGAWNFHRGTSWGKKVWAKHCRIYLEKHGKPLRAPSQDAPTFAPDIVFPFRTQSREVERLPNRPGRCSGCGLPSLQCDCTRSTPQQTATEIASKLTKAQREAVIGATFRVRDGVWHPEGWYTRAADKRVRRALASLGLIRDYLRRSYPLTELGLAVRAILTQTPSEAS